MKTTINSRQNTISAYENLERIRELVFTTLYSNETAMEHLNAIYQIASEDPNGFAELIRQITTSIIEGNDPRGKAEELLVSLCSDNNTNIRSQSTLLVKDNIIKSLKRGFATRLEEQNALRIAVRCLVNDTEIAETVRNYQPRSLMGRLYCYIIINRKHESYLQNFSRNLLIELFPRIRTKKVSVYCSKCGSWFEKAIVIDPKRDQFGFAEYCHIPDALSGCLCTCKQKGHAMEKLLELTTQGKHSETKARTIASALAWCAYQPERLREYQHAVFRLSNALFCQVRWEELMEWNRTHNTIAIELWIQTIPALVQYYAEPQHTELQREIIRKSIEMLIGYTIIVSEPIPEAIKYVRSPKPIPDDLWNFFVRSACDFVEFYLYQPELMAIESKPQNVEECLGDIMRRRNRWFEALTRP